MLLAAFTGAITIVTFYNFISKEGKDNCTYNVKKAKQSDAMDISLIKNELEHIKNNVIECITYSNSLLKQNTEESDNNVKNNIVETLKKEDEINHSKKEECAEESTNEENKNETPSLQPSISVDKPTNELNIDHDADKEEDGSNGVNSNESASTDNEASTKEENSDMYKAFDQMCQIFGGSAAKTVNKFRYLTELKE